MADWFEFAVLLLVTVVSLFVNTEEVQYVFDGIMANNTDTVKSLGRFKWTRSLNQNGTK